jgi:hypothetical protein
MRGMYGKGGDGEAGAEEEGGEGAGEEGLGLEGAPLLVDLVGVKHRQQIRPFIFLYKRKLI